MRVTSDFSLVAVTLGKCWLPPGIVSSMALSSLRFGEVYTIADGVGLFNGRQAFRRSVGSKNSGTETLNYVSFVYDLFKSTFLFVTELH